MLKSFSQYAVSLWVKNSVIPAEDAPIYSYGLELLLSTVINIIVMICISLIVGKPLIMVPYILAFIPLRIFSGGYHSKTHVNCIIFNATLYIVAINSIYIVLLHNVTIICTFLNFISLFLVIAFSPVAAKNKPLTHYEVIQYRKYSIYISIFIMVISLILYRLCIIDSHLYIMACFGELNAVFLMTLGRYL